MLPPRPQHCPTMAAHEACARMWPACPTALILGVQQAGLCPCSSLDTQCSSRSQHDGERGCLKSSVIALSQNKGQSRGGGTTLLFQHLGG